MRSICSKKIRALALKHALSAKARAGEITVVSVLAAKEAKTAALRSQFGKLAWTSADHRRRRA